jgi:hypothetical protein
LDCGSPLPLLPGAGNLKSGRGLPQSKAACGGNPAFHNPRLPPLKQIANFYIFECEV